MSRPSILFYCSSLEPAKDGVGDYTRALARQCQTSGYDCHLVALNDQHLKGSTILHEEGEGILRLPEALSWNERTLALQTHLRGFAPQITSWQFVSYGFSPKGFPPRSLGLIAKRFSPGVRHLMMHETWIGVSAGSPVKERLIGWLQKGSIRRFIGSLAPQLTHTSNKAYCHLLEELGVKAAVLPLFGNIAVSTNSLLPREAAQALDTGEGMIFSVLLFGTLHPQWKPAEFIAWIISLSRRLGKTPLILAAGRLGPHAPALLSQLSVAGLKLIELGEQPADCISSLMQRCSMGLVVHPWALIGKSGVAAVMLDHGLPTLVARDDWALRGTGALQDTGINEDLLLGLRDADETHTDHWLSARRPPSSSLPLITRRFLADTLARGK